MTEYITAAYIQAFFAAGFSFSRGHRILRVPYDFYTPYVFDGEETSMGVRYGLQVSLF